MVTRAMDRRQVLTLAGTAAAWLASANVRAETIEARREEVSSGAQGFRELVLSIPDRRGVDRKSTVYVPEHLDPTQTHPALILLHGYGQARDEKRALQAWKKEYGLLDAYSTLRNVDFAAGPGKHYLTESRSAEIHRSIAEQPFAGSILICPVTPVLYFDTGRGELLARFTEWLCSDLLPEVQKVAPIDGARLGLGGVSMGGQVALEVLLREPEAFNSFSGIMVAIEQADVYSYAKRLSASLGRHPLLPLLFLTANSDLYRYANDGLHRALLKREFRSEYLCPPGSHTSEWMRELGCLESLLWHDRQLQPTPPKA